MTTPAATRPKLNLTGLGIECAALGLGLALMMTRHKDAFWRTVPVVGPFNENFSNFAISLMLLLAVGTVAILQHRYKQLAIMAGGLIAANLVVEAFVTTLNTRDMIDAYAGILGVAIGLASLWLVARYGVSPRPEVER